MRAAGRLSGAVWMRCGARIRAVSFASPRIYNAVDAEIVYGIEILLFIYFLVTNGIYICTALVAIARMPLFVKLHRADPIRYAQTRFEEPVSILVPAYNEEEGILETVRSLLEQRYTKYEVVVINDGSIDATLDLLMAHYALEAAPEVYPVDLPTQRVRALYLSQTHPNLRVIDKENGGKGDALNAGINASRYALLFCCDGDSLYSLDALQCVVEPMVDDPKTIVSSAAIGIANGCVIRDAQVVERRLSPHWLVRFQVLEYMRAFLASRLGWAPINSLCIVSGACGMFRKAILIEAGGFRTDTISEDMEITLRIHHLMRTRRQPYRVAYTPFIVCWTRVPETLRGLWNQRRSWHRHVSESVTIHRSMMFGRSMGLIGRLGFPYLVLSEWLAPVVLVFGLAFGFICAYLGFLSYRSQFVLLGLVFSLGLVICAAALLLDALSFNTYTAKDVRSLLAASVFEVFGFRQFVTAANLAGFWAWFVGKPMRGRLARPGWRLPPYEPNCEDASDGRRRRGAGS